MSCGIVRRPFRPDHLARYFAGLTAEQTASSLSISLRTANRHWAFAGAWLYRRRAGLQ